MQISISTADVDSPTAEYSKAAVVVEDRIIIIRNLVGQVLEVLNLDKDVELAQEESGSQGAVYRGVSEGEAVIVRRTFECQCGGTRVYPK
jgi:hypothetical protein